MVMITFPDRETEKRGLASLLGRFSGRVLRTGEHLVPESALEALADANIPFTVKGKATYEQQSAAEHRSQVHSMPGKLATQAVEELRALLDRCQSEVITVDRLESVALCHRRRYRELVETFRQVACEELSYSDCRHLISRLDLLHRAVEELQGLARAERSVKDCAMAEAIAAREQSVEARKFLGLQKVPGCSATALGFASYFTMALAAVFVADTFKLNAVDSPEAIMISGLLVCSAGPVVIGFILFSVLKRARARLEAAGERLVQKRNMLEARKRDRTEYEKRAASFLASV